MATDLDELQNKLWEVTDLLRVDAVAGQDVCRTGVPASSHPICGKNKRGADALFQGCNNSTRELPADGVDVCISERFGAPSG